MSVEFLNTIFLRIKIIRNFIVYDKLLRTTCNLIEINKLVSI